MATIETWATEKLAEYGAIYPMVGSEWVWLTVAVVFWLAWHFKTSAAETEEQAELASRGHNRVGYKQNVCESSYATAKLMFIGFEGRPLTGAPFLCALVGYE